MNEPAHPQASAAEQRQRQLIFVACAVVILGVLAFVFGGKSSKEASDSAQPVPQRIRIGGASEPATVAGQDPFFPELNEKTEMVEPAETPEAGIAIVERGQPPSVDLPRSAVEADTNGTTKTINVASMTPSAKDRDAQSAASSTKPPVPSSAPPTDSSAAPASAGAGTQSPASTSTTKPPVVATTTETTSSQKKPDLPKQQPAIVRSRGDSALPPAVAKQQSPRLKLKKPSKPISGVIAHTEGVIDEDEFRREAKPKTNAPSPKPRVVKVTKPQAQAFAERATSTSQAEGSIPKAQRFRLPKQQESPSPATWREQDQPTTPKERRPFGLVLTEQGIPVRDVPAGESALKKNGVDKPLWKRPQ